MSIILSKNNIGNQIEEETIKRIKSGLGSSFLYIVSTNRSVKNLSKIFIELAGNAFLSPQVFTLKTLSTKLYRSFGSGRQKISEAIQTIMMQDIIELMELEYFGPDPEFSIPQGTIIRLVETINRLKTAGVYPEILELDLYEANESETKKLNDLIRIYKRYEKELRENNLVDEADITHEVASMLSKNQNMFSLIFPELDLVVISGYDVFSTHNFNIINSIADIKGVDMYIALELVHSNPGLFGHLIENFQNFLDNGFQIVHRITEQDREYLSLNLFSENEPSGKIDLTEKISLIKTKTRENEVEAIAKLVKSITTQTNKEPLNRIGVTFYQLETYAPLIREIFPLYGIPFDISTGYELSNSPVVIAILSLLEAVEDNFSRRNVIRALKTPYFCFSYSEETDEQEEDNVSNTIDDGNLYAVSTNLKITSGIPDWREKINERLKSIEFELNESSIERSQIEEQRLALIKAQNDIEFFIKLLEPIRKRLKPKDFKDKLIFIIESLRLPQQILTGLSENELQVKKNIQAYKKFIEVLDSVIDFIELKDVNEPKSLVFYLNALKTAISQSKFSIRKKQENGVQIVTITDMVKPMLEPQESPFDIVFMGGLVDTEFPSVFYPDIFLSEKRAKSEQDRLLEDRFLFYQTITVPEKKLYLSYPMFGNEGVELVRSPFIDELVRIADIAETNIAEIDQVIYNEEKLLKIYGEHFWHGHKLNFPFLPKEISDKLQMVEHNIEIQKSRTEQKPKLPEYNGRILEHIKSSSQEKIRGFKDKSYSISQLETYGKCPFRYFAQRILRLNQLEEIEEELSFIEHGNLLHEIMYEFYSYRKEQKPIKECNDYEFEDAVKQLLDIAKAKIAQINLTGLFWQIKVEHIIGEEDKRKGILRSFLEEIDRVSKTQTVPKHFEVPFGNMKSSNKEIEIDLGEIKIGDVKMQGKIDRVEIGDGFFVVADYKTGGTEIKIDDIIEGRSIQLPIYINALEQYWEQQGIELKGVAGIYYKLRDECRAELGLGDAEYKDIAFQAHSTSGQIVPGRKINISLDEVVKRAVDYIHEYVESISQGEFPLTPHEQDKVCRYCPYKRICRILPTH